MGLRWGVVAVVLCGCVGAGPDARALDVALSPGAFSARVTELTVTIHATDSKGLVGKGAVTLSVDVGTIDPGQTTLDVYGSARAKWTCTMGCQSGGKVTAVWGAESAAAEPTSTTRAATFEAPIGVTGGGAGGGGGSGPTTTTVSTDANWRVTAAAPTGAWQIQSFNDSAWGSAVVIAPAGPGVGAPSIWDLGPTTQSGSLQIWTRHLFIVPGQTVDSALLDVACNDDMSVWINGTQVVNDMNGVNTFIQAQDLRSFVVPGDNVIAATCRDVVLPDHSFWSKLVIRTH